MTTTEEDDTHRLTQLWKLTVLEGLTTKGFEQWRDDDGPLSVERLPALNSDGDAVCPTCQSEELTVTQTVQFWDNTPHANTDAKVVESEQSWWNSSHVLPEQLQCFGCGWHTNEALMPGWEFTS